MAPNERNGPADERNPRRAASRSSRAPSVVAGRSGSGQSNVAGVDRLQAGRMPAVSSSRRRGGAGRAVRRGVGQDNPFAVARSHEAAGGEGHRAAFPKVPGGGR